MTDAQKNILAALSDMTKKGKAWLPLSVLDSFDSRSVAALSRAGKIEINFDYGVRVK